MSASLNTLHTIECKKLTRNGEDNRPLAKTWHQHPQNPHLAYQIFSNVLGVHAIPKTCDFFTPVFHPFPSYKGSHNGQ